MVDERDERDVQRLATLSAYEFDMEYQRVLAELRARYLACSSDALDNDTRQRWHAYEAEKQAIAQRFAAAAQLRQHHLRQSPQV